MRLFKHAFVAWLPLAVAITGTCLLIYVTVQQNYRQSLNDPQIQMAEDGAARLEAGGVPAELVQRGVAKTDIAESLAPWIVVYDASGTPLESSAVLDGALPILPQGIFNPSTWHTYAEYRIPLPMPQGETRFTWQPRAGVRQALVIVSAGRYFVVVGRNMREGEYREAALGEIVLLAWGCIMAASLIARWILARSW